MRATLGLILAVGMLTLPGTGSAGLLSWLGPSSEDECIEALAAKGASRRLVGGIYNACRIAFDPDSHPIERRQYRCMAEGFAEVQNEHAAEAVADACRRKHPDPPCPSGQWFSYSRAACTTRF